jgi:enhancing lycopene biosynthesis protein 2
MNGKNLNMETKRFAVFLAGCGVYDGSEIHEAVCVLLAIDQLEAKYQCFAPDINQYHVINHLTGEVVKETRSVLVESARIARGEVKAMSLFDPSVFDAVVIPGGFGVAKNLCTFAIDGPDCEVNKDTETAVNRAHNAELPIGALCIAPALMAKILQKGKITIGNDSGTANAVESLGAKHIVSSGYETVIDKENKIVTSPCYMLDSPISVISHGAANVVKALIELM